MNRTNVSYVLRGDAIFNGLAGLVLLFNLLAVLALIGWPAPQAPIYSQTLGAALIGLALAVWFAAGHPETSRDTILASIIAKSLAGAVILYSIYLGGTALPNPILLPAAVGVQVLFVLGEAAYLYRGK